MTGNGAYVHNIDCKREKDILRLITESTAPRTAHLAKITAENISLSDPGERDFKEECDHGHHLRCYMCEDLKDVVNDIKQQILESSASMYSKEYQEDLLYDLRRPELIFFSGKPTFCDR